MMMIMMIMTMNDRWQHARVCQCTATRWRSGRVYWVSWMINTIQLFIMEFKSIKPRDKQEIENFPEIV